MARLGDQARAAAGLITPRELETGRRDPIGARGGPAAYRRQGLAALIQAGGPTLRDDDRQATLRGRLGGARARHQPDRPHAAAALRARPAGTIERDHGAHVFPDSNAKFEGEKPQFLYTVRFAARELWGEAANPADAVYLDLWEDYLDAV